MFRQSPNRSQRSKGFKVKHVLQICFLLAICFWLLYQVKHSRDKKKEFDEGDVKVSQRTQSRSDSLKLGRKDLNPRVEETTATSTKGEDEEPEEENAGGGEEEEETKLEEENAEDKKSEEKGDEQGGAGDDDTDEHEEDKSDAEVDREEDVIEEEKENEEKDSEDNDGSQLDSENSVDEHDGDEQGHGAREENYKADDASSAVTQGTEVVDTENENGKMNKSDGLAARNLAGNELVANDTSENSVGEQTTVPNVEDQKLAEEGSDPITHNKGTENVESKSDDQLKLANNATEASSVTLNLSMGNVTERDSENVTTEGTSSPGLGSNSSLSSTMNQANSSLTTSTKAEEAELGSEETSNTDNSTLSATPEQLQKSANETENNNAAEDTKPEGGFNDGSEDGADGVLETENQDNEIERDPIDSSDSAIGLDEKEVRNDLETLPDVLTEGSNNDEEDAAAAE